VIIGFVFLQGRPALADPMAFWAGPWQVTLGFDEVVFQASVKSAFGQNADNGEIQDRGSSFEPLVGTQAWAKASSKTTAGGCITACLDNFGDTGVSFERAFRLEGSPSGLWDVVFGGSLTGDLHADDEPFNPYAKVSAEVFITPLTEPNNILASENWFYDVIQGEPDVHVRDPRSRLGVFKDGDYLVRGDVMVTSQATEQFLNPGSATAVANFFDCSDCEGLAGLVVGVAAAPLGVPEPATVVLLGIAVGALGGWAQRRRA